jgi:hypothetical protein
MPAAGVEDDDFQQILTQIRQFVRTAVVRESRKFWPKTEFRTISGTRPRTTGGTHLPRRSPVAAVRGNQRDPAADHRVESGQSGAASAVRSRRSRSIKAPRTTNSRQLLRCSYRAASFIHFERK